ncbi:hypothetical protein [Desulfosporosinus sp. FKB]|uniref:hypothetical protein n=1 Tax=Desulfosporosinus sp. FKB TaxID=1969835 RepID=UPI001FA918CC|nr:hypothetical protein [Desulfosporosinus sp. FKB]
MALIKYHRNDTVASDPVNITLSNKKLKILRPDLYGIRGVSKRKIREIIEEHIFYGDSQPAIVISLKPLLVAAYSDELDCIAMLSYPESFVIDYFLEEKTKLITINTYTSNPPYQKDLIIGQNQLNNWYGFHPIIAEFVSEDIEKIQSRKEMVNEDNWDYVYKLGIEYAKKNPNVWRDGRPMFSKVSAL